eukprot:Cvel_23741.t3-p1 / transcript=Cvel_23741.t3 / gene=Cvel_23741 / organism=Chromera_velia_CCMP2878 / gene_product=hypothetical protein / transcript_product=hypothetical protein / location=Cvel_scaffold2485:1811-3331(+) / protein_length=507 / sequence_SO=supercontig / SO=protein_coding / is_pseudo=false
MPWDENVADRGGGVQLPPHPQTQSQQSFPDMQQPHLQHQTPPQQQPAFFPALPLENGRHVQLAIASNFYLPEGCIGQYTCTVHPFEGLCWGEGKYELAVCRSPKGVPFIHLIKAGTFDRSQTFISSCAGESYAVGSGEDARPSSSTRDESDDKTVVSVSDESSRSETSDAGSVQDTLDELTIRQLSSSHEEETRASRRAVARSYLTATEAACLAGNVQEFLRIAVRMGAADPSNDSPQPSSDSQKGHTREGNSGGGSGGGWRPVDSDRRSWRAAKRKRLRLKLASIATVSDNVRIFNALERLGVELSSKRVIAAVRRAATRHDHTRVWDSLFTAGRLQHRCVERFVVAAIEHRAWRCVFWAAMKGAVGRRWLVHRLVQRGDLTLLSRLQRAGWPLKWRGREDLRDIALSSRAAHVALWANEVAAVEASTKRRGRHDRLCADARISRSSSPCLRTAAMGSLHGSTMGVGGDRGAASALHHHHHAQPDHQHHHTSPPAPGSSGFGLTAQ